MITSAKRSELEIVEELVDVLVELAELKVIWTKATRLLQGDESDGIVIATLAAIKQKCLLAEKKCNEIHQELILCQSSQ